MHVCTCNFTASASQGTIPADLRGTYILNGPGSFDVGGEQRMHFLDGHGLVSSFSFDGGEVIARRKLVRTRALREEAAAGATPSLICDWTRHTCCELVGRAA